MYESGIIERLNQLIRAGEEVVASKQSTGVIASPSVDQAKFQRWRTGSLSFLTTTMGEKSIHLIEFVGGCKEHLYGMQSLA